MMQSPPDSNADKVVAGDLETARQYGAGVAEVTNYAQMSKEH